MGKIWKWTILLGQSFGHFPCLLGKSLGLKLYFTVYPSSRQNTDTVQHDERTVSLGKTVEKPQELSGKFGPPMGKFPDNSCGFSTVSQTSGFKNRRECVQQELCEHILGFPQGSLTVLNPDFGF